MSEHAQSYHVQYLKAELDRRKQKNARYSMRAFASFLDIHPSALSRILNGVQEISLPTARIVLQQLKMSDDEKRLFLASVAEEKRYRAALVLAEATNIPLEEVGFGGDSVLSVAPYYGFAIDVNKCILYINESAASWLKTVPQKLIGQSLSTAGLPSAFTGPLDELIEKARTVEKPMRTEVIYDNSEGPRGYELSASPVRSKVDNQIYALIIAVHDITDRKTVSADQEARIESEKILRLRAETAAAQSQILQGLSARFARTDSLSEIAHIAISKLIEHLKASGGAIFRLSRDARYLEPIQTTSPKTTLRTGRMSIDNNMPTSACARTGLPVWNQTLKGSDPDVVFIRSQGFEPGVISVSALPLHVHGHLVGALNLRFRESRDLSADEKKFLETVAELVAHAVDRSGYTNETKRAFELVDAILHEAPVAILFVDRSLTVVRANDEFARIAKRPLDTLLNQPLRRTRLFDDLELTLDKVIHERKPVRDLEVSFLGSELRVSIYPVFDKSSKGRSSTTIEVLGAGVVVTELKMHSSNRRRSLVVQQVLLDIGRSLNVPMGLRETVQRFFRQVIPAFADVCAIHVNGLDDLADLAALYPTGLERGDLYARVRTQDAWQLIEEVQETNKGKLFSHESGSDSMICVPLLGFDRQPGTLTLFSSRTTHVFDDDDLAAALEMAAAFSIALRNAERPDDDHVRPN